MKVVIGLSGKQYAGKDTAANILINRYLSEFGFVRRSLVDKLKVAYYDANFLKLDIPDFSKISAVNYAKAHDPQTRSKLIAMGDAMRANDPDVFTRALMESDDKFIVVSDLRLQSELRYFQDHADRLLHVRVHSDRSVRNARGVVTCDNDPTETDLDATRPDVTVENHGDFESLYHELKVVAFHAGVAVSSVYMNRALDIFTNEVTAWACS